MVKTIKACKIKKKIGFSCYGFSANKATFAKLKKLFSLSIDFRFFFVFASESILRLSCRGAEIHHISLNTPVRATLRKLLSAIYGKGKGKQPFFGIQETISSSPAISWGKAVLK